jgi:hypothetical protein
MRRLLRLKIRDKITATVAVLNGVRTPYVLQIDESIHLIAKISDKYAGISENYGTSDKDLNITKSIFK